MESSPCPASGDPSPARRITRCHGCGGLVAVTPDGRLAPHRPPRPPADLTALDRLMRRRTGSHTAPDSAARVGLPPGS